MNGEPYQYDYNTNFAPLAMLEVSLNTPFGLISEQLPSLEW